MKSSRTSAGRPVQRRSGFAVLLVLGLLAMTLALAYASLRSQTTVAQLAENMTRSDEARLAAEAGIYAALRKMSAQGWSGVDSTISAPVEGHSWYEASFAAGDARLRAGDPDYRELPFRVTIHSTGFATDPSDPAVRSMHCVQAVVQLARRRLSPGPPLWSMLEPLTVHQWSNRKVALQFPARIDGTVHLLGEVELAGDYPESSHLRQRYLRDLNLRRMAGKPDHRLFGGTVLLPFSRQTGDVLSLLDDDLGLSLINTSAPTGAPVTHPGSVVSYRLFPGGKSYTPPILQATYGSTLQNVALGPDPATNPLGLFRSRNSLAIHNNVHIRGTLISEGSTPDVQVYGTNVKLEAARLAGVESTSSEYQLPAVIIRDDLRIHPASDTHVIGQAVIYDELELRSGPVSTRFKLEGQLLTSGLAVRGRTEFDALPQVQWATHYVGFLSQTGIPHFPDWLEQHAGLPVAPRLTIERGSTSVKHHWQDWSQPVYQPDPADAGLRWNLVGWVEG